MIDYFRKKPIGLYCDECKSVMLDSEKVYHLNGKHLCKSCLEEITGAEYVEDFLDAVAQAMEEGYVS